MKNYLSFLLFLSFFIINLVFAKSKCVAHRGNSSVHLENSFSSIISAARMKVYAIEFDVRHTSDGVPILMHNKTPKKVVLPFNDCPRKKKISKVTYKQLKRCLLRNGEQIPTLERILQVLSKYPVRLFIEYKDMPNNKDLLLLAKYYEDMPEKLLLTSFDNNVLQWVINQYDRYNFLADVELLELIKIPQNNLQYSGVDIYYKALTNNYLKELQDQQKTVGVWTVNKSKYLVKFLKMGVDYITTNFPRICLDLQ